MYSLSLLRSALPPLLSRVPFLRLLLSLPLLSPSSRPLSLSLSLYTAVMINNTISLPALTAAPDAVVMLMKKKKKRKKTKKRRRRRRRRGGQH